MISRYILFIILFINCCSFDWSI